MLQKFHCMKRNRLLIFVLAAFLSACRVYTPGEQPASVLFSENKTADPLGNYHVHAPSGEGIYRHENPALPDDSIFGNTAQEESTVNTIPLDSVAGKIATARENIRSGNIRRIKRGDDDGLILGMSIMLALLLLVLAIVIVVWLIIALVNASSNAAGNAANGSGSSSSNGSGSGGSGSNSGGSGSSSGCYIATMVYGSYNAPQVMILRRFRDESLSRTSGGRVFIRWYYSWSPAFVKKYNHYAWIHKTCRFVLDRFVKSLGG